MEPKSCPPFARRSLFLLILVVTAIPLGYTPGQGVAPTRAYCQNGTCCPEPGAFCVVSDIVVQNYYYKSSGSCKEPPITTP